MKKIVTPTFMIDNRKKVNAIEQIKTFMKHSIAKRTFPIGAACDSVDAIAQHNGIDSHFVFRAFNELASEGYLKKKDDCFYIEPIELLDTYFDELIPLADAIEKSGFKVDYENLKQTYVKSLPKRFKTYQKEKDTTYMFIRRIFYGNRIPMFITDIYYSEKYFSDPKNRSLGNVRIYDYLREYHGVEVTRSNRKISVKRPPEEINTLLNNASDAAIFEIEAVGYDQNGAPFEFAIGYTMSNYALRFKSIIE